MKVTGYRSTSASKPNFQFLFSGELTIEFESTQEGLAPSRLLSSKLNPPQGGLNVEGGFPLLHSIELFNLF
jgi:hypothetical protein